MTHGRDAAHNEARPQRSTAINSRQDQFEEEALRRRKTAQRVSTIADIDLNRDCSSYSAEEVEARLETVNADLARLENQSAIAALREWKSHLERDYAITQQEHQRLRPDLETTRQSASASTTQVPAHLQSRISALNQATEQKREDVARTKAAIAEREKAKKEQYARPMLSKS